MKTMQAFARTAADSGEVTLVEVPVPVPGNGEVLVRVHAFGVGIHDRSFIAKEPAFPYPIGTEGAGTVAESGAQITDVSVGDRVIFTTSMQPQGGAWAEYAAVRRDTLVPLPGGLTFAQGAALPVAGKAALESLNALGLQRGETLFVAGASGAIGSLVIQLAAAQGIRVSGSASAGNHAYMRRLGVDHAVDYQDADWPGQVRAWAGGGVDAALAIQPGTGIASQTVVRDGGQVVTVSGDSAQVSPVRSITVRQIGHSPGTHRQFAELVNEIARGGVQLTIEKEYPFADALEALKKTETRHARGKSVVVL